LVSQLPQTNATQAELSVHGPRAATNATPIPVACRKLGWSRRLCDLGFTRHERIPWSRFL